MSKSTAVSLFLILTVSVMITGCVKEKTTPATEDYNYNVTTVEKAIPNIFDPDGLAKNTTIITGRVIGKTDKTLIFPDRKIQINGSENISIKNNTIYVIIVEHGRIQSVNEKSSTQIGIT